MLIAENRDGLPRPPKNFNNSLHQFVARVKFLAAIVVRVVPVLADKAYRIHCQVVTAECERLPDSGEDLESVFFGQATAQIRWRNLVRIHRNQASAWLGKDSVWRIAIQKSAYNDVGMGIESAIVGVHGNDGGDGLLRGLGNRLWGGNGPESSSNHLAAVHHRLM